MSIITRAHSDILSNASWQIPYGLFFVPTIIAKLDFIYDSIPVLVVLFHYFYISELQGRTLEVIE